MLLPGRNKCVDIEPLKDNNILPSNDNPTPAMQCTSHQGRDNALFLSTDNLKCKLFEQNDCNDFQRKLREVAENANKTAHPLSIDEQFETFYPFIEKAPNSREVKENIESVSAETIKDHKDNSKEIGKCNIKLKKTNLSLLETQIMKCNGKGMAYYHDVIKHSDQRCKDPNPSNNCQEIIKTDKDSTELEIGKYYVYAKDDINVYIGKDTCKIYATCKDDTKVLSEDGECLKNDYLKSDFSKITLKTQACLQNQGGFYPLIYNNGKCVIPDNDSCSMGKITKEVTEYNTNLNNISPSYDDQKKEIKDIISAHYPLINTRPTLTSFDENVPSFHYTNIYNNTKSMKFDIVDKDIEKGEDIGKCTVDIIDEETDPYNANRDSLICYSLHRKFYKTHPSLSRKQIEVGFLAFSCSQKEKIGSENIVPMPASISAMELVKHYSYSYKEGNTDGVEEVTKGVVRCKNGAALFLTDSLINKDNMKSYKSMCVKEETRSKIAKFISTDFLCMSDRNDWVADMRDPRHVINNPKEHEIDYTYGNLFVTIEDIEKCMSDVDAQQNTSESKPIMKCTQLKKVSVIVL